MKSTSIFRLFTLGIMLVTIAGCEYDDYPDAVWDPDATGGATPQITSVDPPDVVYDGLSTITITGENFSPVLNQNQVTFNGVVAEINTDLSSPTQLVLTMPIIITDAALNFVTDVQIMVAVQGAYSGAVYAHDFRVERAVIEWGGFSADKPLKEPNAIACDSDGNAYVAGGGSDKILYKIDTAGVRTEFGSGLASITRDLKVGPGGAVFYARNNPFVYRIPPEGGTGVASPRIKSKIACFDFNVDQNIYASGKNDSIYFYDTVAGTVKGVADSEDYTYTTLRVYDGYVYVAGIYEGADTNVTVTQAVWRHEILADDMLGAKELVYDWASYEYAAEQSILTMLVNSEGLFYLGVSEGTGPAIINLDISTQEVTPFYDAVLISPATHLTWGPDNFLFCVREMAAPTDAVPTAAFRIAQTKTSAPNYGRD